MKKMRLKHVLLLAIIFLFTNQVFAQNGSTEDELSKAISIRVSAVLQGAIEIITMESLDFTNMQQTAQQLSVSPLSSDRAGKMIARGLANARFRIEFENMRELSNLEGEGILIFDYSVAGSEDENQNTAELLEADMRDINFNEEGEYYIWVGGSVDLSQALPGMYEGEFIINIEYI